MIVRIHKTGSSFKGCAAYLLHDKDAGTSERVGWVETVNMATSNPQTAWRVMAATAMMQNDIKAAAGIKATGRQAKGTVLHYSLSWKGEESPEHLTKEAMIRAAKSSLSAYGVDPALFKPGARNIPKRRQFADEHQAMIICHTDEKHPHVHIMVNRVHPGHGCILPTGKDRDKLSAWANDYEHKTGQVFCANRADAWDSRRRNIWVKGAGNVPRHTFEMAEKTLPAPGNDNDRPALQRLKSEQKALNDALARDGGEQFKRHRQAWQDLSQAHQDRQKAVRNERAQAIKATKQASIDEYGPQFATLRKRHDLELEAFQDDEGGARSKASNVWESVKLLAKIRGENPKDFRFRDVFTPFAGHGARLELLQKAQAQEKRALEREQDARLAAAMAQARQKEKTALAANNERYAREKSDLSLVQEMENAALKGRWKARNEDQRDAYAAFAAKQDKRSALMDAYLASALPSYDLDPEPEADKDKDRGKDDGHDM